MSRSHPTDDARKDNPRDAYRNLNPHQMKPPGPVYHGSTHGFAEGDTVDPTPDRTHMSRDPRGDKAAFGVTNTDTAGYFGAYRGRNMKPGEQGRLFASVYEVDPVSHFEHHPSAQSSYNEEEQWRYPSSPHAELPPNLMPIDRKGFKVKRHAAFAFLDDDNYTETIQETP